MVKISFAKMPPTGIPLGPMETAWPSGTVGSPARDAGGREAASPAMPSAGWPTIGWHRDLTRDGGGAFTGHDRKTAVRGGRGAARGDGAARLPGGARGSGRRRRVVGDVPVRHEGLPRPAGRRER